MPSGVRWTEYATNQLARSAEYLEQEREGSGEAFLQAVEASCQMISAFPDANPKVPGEPESTRKAILPRFGYWIVYDIQDDGVVILTIWNAIRRPGTWKP